jgi:16S rRNA (guanine527-N7)-methyltransferase
MPAAIRTVDGPAAFALAFGVSRETVARLETYAALLRQWQKAVNLVAPSTLDEVWHRHFADSGQLLACAPAARTWVDIGSGAGFPGLVVAIMLADPASHAEGYARNPQANPVRRVTLIDSNERKCAFLREVARMAGITGERQSRVVVDILSTRIERAATQATLQGPDVISARALAPLDKLLTSAAPLFASNTVGLFLKGRDALSELAAAKKAWNFNAEMIPSRTERDARVIVVRNLELKREGKRS